MAREDRAVSPDMVFLPFAYVEAAANILTNPAVDPYGKIPEFKFSAVKVEAAGTRSRRNRPCIGRCAVPAHVIDFGNEGRCPSQSLR